MIDQEAAKPALRGFKRHVLVCVGPRCTRNGESEALFNLLGERLKAHGLDDGEGRVKRTRCNCFAVCRGGPIVVVYPEGIWYWGVTPEILEEIIVRHLKGGEVVVEHVFHNTKGL